MLFYLYIIKNRYKCGLRSLIQLFKSGLNLGLKWSKYGPGGLN